MTASPEGATGRRAHRVTRPYRKVSVTLPADLLDEIRGKVGPGNLSRYLTEAADEKRRHEALDDWLTRMEAEHGPVPPEAEAAADRLWSGTEGSDG